MMRFMIWFMMRVLMTSQFPGRGSVQFRLLMGALAVITPFFSVSARAADTSDVDKAAPDEPVQKREIDRTWLYADDAHVAAPFVAIGMTSLSYTNAGASPTRADSPFPTTYNAFAANTAQPGAMMSFGGEVGLLPHFSIAALGQVGAGGEASSPNAGALAGARFGLLPSSWTSTHLVASVGYLREAWGGPIYDDETNKWLPGSPHGDNGAWLQLAFSGDLGRARVATTLHGEHIFVGGRDPLDVMVQLGASYRLVGGFRAGVEYVGQDLEEALAPAADGGARHFLGPIASLQLFRDRLTVGAGPSFGLSPTSPRLLGRVAVAYGF